jgi:conjugal transfer/entry exclusion protein
MKRSILIAVLCVGLAPSVAFAQLPVIDSANLTQNTITAVQSVLIVLNQLIELTALEGLMDIAEDLAAISALASEAAALGFELGSLQSQVLVLFDLTTAPATSFEYRIRAGKIRLMLLQSYSYAMRTQTLIMSALRTVEHILAFIEHAAAAIGNLTISQSLAEAQAKLQQLATEANVRQAAFERAKSVEGVSPGVLIQSIININEAQMADHPR